MSYVLHDVLELQNVIRGLHQGVKAVVDLALARGTNLVVAALNVKTRCFKLQNDGVADVGQVVNWRNREVATLEWRLVSKVSTLFVASRVPSSLNRVHDVERCVGLVLVANLIEDEEFCFWCEERGVRDAGGR